jgi:hypothetical protein
LEKMIIKGDMLKLVKEEKKNLKEILTEKDDV